MPVISVLILALWTLVVLRVLAVRATLRVRTLATYLLLGALLGIIAAPLVRALAAPYGEQGPYINGIMALSMQVVFLTPVILHLFVRRVYAVTSVADAFLLAFVTGFGFDLIGALLAASVARAPLKGLSWWPPWQLDAVPVSVAGYGYWSGLVALGVAAALRFGRKFYISVIVGVLLLVWVASEQAALFSPIQEKAENWIAAVGNLTMHGALTAWIAVVALVALSTAETLWVRRGGASQVSFQFVKQLKSLVIAPGRGKLKKLLRLSTVFRLKMQTALAHAELMRSPNNVELCRVANHLDQRLQEMDCAPAGANVPPAMPFWRSYRIGQTIIVLTLAAVVLFPASVGAFFWSLPVLHFRFPGLPTLLVDALMIGICWCFLVAAGRPASTADADNVMQFLGQRGILNLSLLAVLLVFFFTPLDSLYPFPSLIAQFAGSQLPEFAPAKQDSASHPTQLATILLLFAAAAASVSLSRAGRWRQAAITERRKAALRYALDLAGAFVGVWLCLAIYKDVLGWSHSIFGAVFFKIQRLFNLKETIGASGNTVGAATAAFLICLLCLAGLVLHRLVSDRIETFLIGERPSESSLPARGQGQAA